MARIGLTTKHKRFVEEYLLDQNGRQAAIRAGYSSVSAITTASELLTYPNIKQAIEDGLEQRRIENEGLRLRIVAELMRIAFLDPRKVFSWEQSKVEVKSSSELDEDTARCVVGVEWTKQGVKVKLANKMDALDKLANHLGMFRDKTDETVQELIKQAKEHARIMAEVESRLAGGSKTE
jgi:phage terminase small subunit